MAPLKFLQHNAHFRDKGCRFEPFDAVFDLAPRRPRDREPLFLGLCSRMLRTICCPLSHHPLFHHFCRPKISQAQNGFPRITRPVFRRRLPVQHITWTASTTNMDGLPYFLLASSLLQHANRPHNFLTQSSLNYLSLPKVSKLWRGY